MKLSKISIKNFRCFEHYEIELAPNITVLIGKNGTGKSTMIQALKRGLSFIFNKETSLAKTSSRSLSGVGLNVVGYNQLDALYTNEKDNPEYPISISCVGELDNHSQLEWVIQKDSANGRLLSTLYKEAYEKYVSSKENPLLIVFSDSYPHIESNLTKYAVKTLTSGKKIPQNFAYYQWNSDTACTEVWERRFINTWNEILNKQLAFSIGNDSSKIKGYLQELDFDSIEDGQSDSSSLKNEAKLKDLLSKAPIYKNLWDAQILKTEIQFITKCLKTFSQPTSEISFNSDFEVESLSITKRDRKDYIEILFKNGKQLLFKQLPAGYRRLFSMVFDIAYRAFILKRGNESFLPINTSNIQGIVIIDEIDLHLHPTLEQEVLQRFQQTFPNVQFIISTHSPLVVTNLKDEDNSNYIIRLDIDCTS